jgi:hypothetical protein
MYQMIPVFSQRMTQIKVKSTDIIRCSATAATAAVATIADGIAAADLFAALHAAPQPDERADCFPDR